MSDENFSNVSPGGRTKLHINSKEPMCLPMDPVGSIKIEISTFRHYFYY